MPLTSIRNRRKSATRWLRCLWSSSGWMRFRAVLPGGSAAGTLVGAIWSRHPGIATGILIG